MTTRLARHESLVIGVLVFLACVAANLFANGGGWQRDNYELGGEYIRIAFALLDGQGYSDAFGVGTGPTGWMPPAYTCLMAAIASITRTPQLFWPPTAIFLLVGIKCACIGWSIGLAASVMKAIGVPRLACLSLVPVWLVLGAWISWSGLTDGTHDVWWLAWVLMLGLHGIVTLTRSRHQATLVAGLILAALSSPVLMVAMMGTLFMRILSFPAKFRWSRGLKPALPAMLIGIVTLSGWIGFVRANTGIWAPGKTNGAFELWQANTMTPDGILTRSAFHWHPINHETLRNDYVLMGERAFLQHHASLARAQLRAEPARFAKQVLNRAANALIWMRDIRDEATIKTSVLHASDSVLSELRTAKLLAPPGHEPEILRFLYMKMSDEELTRFAPGLSPEATDTWMLIRLLNQKRTSESPWLMRIHPVGFMLSGMITLAWATVMLCATPRLRRRLLIPFFCYLGVLTPYILISHYDRYQGILLHLQVIALAAAIGLAWSRWQARSARA